MTAWWGIAGRLLGKRGSAAGCIAARGQ